MSIEAMKHGLAAAEVLEKLFNQAQEKHDALIPFNNVECQITVTDLRIGLYAAQALRQAIEQAERVWADVLRQAVEEVEQEEQAQPVSLFDWLPEGATHTGRIRVRVCSGGALEMRTHAFKYDNGVLKVYVTDNDNEYPGWRDAKDTFFHLNFPVLPLYTEPPPRQPLTDEEIEALLPEPDGTAEIDSVRVLVAPGLYGTEYTEADAWKKESVIQVVRAIEAAHGIKGEA